MNNYCCPNCLEEWDLDLNKLHTSGDGMPPSYYSGPDSDIRRTERRVLSDGPQIIRLLKDAAAVPLSNASLLDIGAGNGRFTNFFSQYLRHTTALEPSTSPNPEWFPRPHITWIGEPLSSVVRCPHCATSAFKLEETFDIIFCWGVWYLFDTCTFLQATQTLLKPGGIFMAVEEGTPSSIEKINNFQLGLKLLSVSAADRSGLTMHVFKASHESCAEATPLVNNAEKNQESATIKK